MCLITFCIHPTTHKRFRSLQKPLPSRMPILNVVVSIFFFSPFSSIQIALPSPIYDENTALFPAPVTQGQR